MGTGNFYYRNASKVFVICENSEDENEESVSPELDEILDELSNIADMLEQNKGDFTFHKYNRLESKHDNRNFSATYIGTLYSNKSFGDISCEIDINVFSRSGYYEAACLDWEIEITVENDTLEGDEIDNLYEYFPDYNSRMNKGMLTIQGNNCVKWLTNTKDKLVTLTENIFEKCSSSYRLVGRFSNGETIYEKCK